MSAPEAEPDLDVYWTFAFLMVALGVVLMCAPRNWFGPSWHYFTEFPSDGFWMGLCCTMLGGWQALTLWHSKQRNMLAARLLSLLFFLGGFVLWTAGVMLATAGLLGHQGLMEAPFMMIVGGHKFVISTRLAARK
jgi:hypothetical protein